MRFARTLAIASVLAVVTVACSDSTGPKKGKPTTTSMTCDNGTGKSVACDIPLTNASKFTITLVSIDCQAHGNVLTLVKPTLTTLTEDGCYTDPAKRTWTFDGPFQSTATMAMTVKSQSFDNPPQLKVTQVPDAAVPTWTIIFEDGYDNDFNDLVFKVEAPNK